MGKYDCGLSHRRLLPHRIHSASHSMAKPFLRFIREQYNFYLPLRVIVVIRSPSLFSPCPLSSYFPVTELAFQAPFRLQETCPFLQTDFVTVEPQTPSIVLRSMEQNSQRHTHLYMYFTHLYSIRQKGWELCLLTEFCVLSMKSGPAMGTRGGRFLNSSFVE